MMLGDESPYRATVAARSPTARTQGMPPPIPLPVSGRGDADEWLSDGDDIITDESTGSELSATCSSGPRSARRDAPYLLTGVRREQRIGKGRFGSVYRASWQGIDVAVKELSDETGGQEIALCRSSGGRLTLEDEAALLFSLRHPNIVSMYGVWECTEEAQQGQTQSESDCGMKRSHSACSLGSRTYMVMEYVPQGDLLSVLHTQGRSFSLATKVHLLREAAQGMAYLASRVEPVIHRDLACRNLLVWQSELDGEWHVKVADFGLARQGPVYQCVTKGQSAPLPMKWMAPEAVFGSNSKASDVWSFGVVMWEVLTNGASPLMIPIEDLREGTRLPQPEQCPDKIYELMKKCWAYEPAERPEFEELVEWLAELQEEIALGEGVSPIDSIGKVVGYSWYYWSRFERTIHAVMPGRRILLILAIVFVSVSLFTSIWDMIEGDSVPPPQPYENLDNPVYEWSPGDVRAWLLTIGPWMGAQLEGLDQLEIDGKLLMALDSFDLRSMGFSRMHASVILDQIETLRTPRTFWSYRASAKLLADHLVTGFQFCPRITIAYVALYYRGTNTFSPFLYHNEHSLWWRWLMWLLIPHLQVAHRSLQFYNMHPVFVTCVVGHALLCTVTEVVAFLTRSAHILLLLPVFGFSTMTLNYALSYVSPQMGTVNLYSVLGFAPLLSSLLFLYINVRAAASIRSRFSRFVTSSGEQSPHRE